MSIDTHVEEKTQVVLLLRCWNDVKNPKYFFVKKAKPY